MIALLAIYAILTQAAQFTGGFGIPYIDFPTSSRASADISGYTVEFTELEGKSLTPSQSLDAHLDQLDLETAPSVKRLVKRIGVAYHHEDTVEVEALRAEFEEIALNDVDSAEYQLILRIVDHGEKYDLEPTVTEQTLVTFQFAQKVADCSLADICLNLTQRADQ
ncbi:MAG: hypothetical protein ACPG8W_01940 [Candidatus Promineifilaceae bacterium]